MSFLDLKMKVGNAPLSVPFFMCIAPCLDRANRADLISFKEADRMAWSFVFVMSV